MGCLAAVSLEKPEYGGIECIGVVSEHEMRGVVNVDSLCLGYEL